MYSEVNSDGSRHEKTNQDNVVKYPEILESNMNGTKLLDGWVLSSPQRSFIVSLLETDE